MSIKGIAFDLYGTLLNVDVAKIGHVYTEFFQKLNLTSRERVVAFDTLLTKNFSSFDSVSKYLNPSSQDLTKDEILSLKSRLDTLLKQVQVFNDTCPILKTLHQLNYKIIVISNVSTPFKEPFERLIGGNIISSVFSCDFGQRKPRKDIFLEGCNKVNLQPHEMLMIGDSIKSDYYGSKKAGLHPVLIDRTKSLVKTTGKITCIDSLHQLTHTIESS